MRLHVISDVHLEFGCWPKSVDINAIDADVSILAGDIDVGLKGIRFALSINRPVIYVMGNHEFYGKRPMNRLWQKARAKVAGTHVHLLENESVMIDGVEFLGATLWSNFMLLGAEQQGAAMQYAESRMSDYSMIYQTRRGRMAWSDERQCPVHLGDRLRASVVMAMHQASVRFLEGKLALPSPIPRVVVTHHAPSARSLEGAEAPGLLDAAYASNLDHLVAQADMWVHGHTHHRVDYQVGQARVVTNPRGYVGGGEVESWEAGYVVTL